MTRKLVLAGMFSGLILFTIQPLAAQTPNEPPLIGSWQLTLTPNTPPVTTPPVIPIPALATFTSDGSMIETDGTEVVPSMMMGGAVVHGTPGHGIWQPAPAIGTLYIQFISLMVNSNATLYARRIVTITGAVDSPGNHFIGGYTYQIIDPIGHVITMGSGIVSGQKIPHPLLP
jgi:hypothetical protein